MSKGFTKFLACFGLGAGLLLASQGGVRAAAYARGDVVVIFRSGITPQDDFSVSPPLMRGGTAPAYTNDRAVNGLLASLGVVRVQRLFASIPRKTAAHARLDFSRAYRLELAGISVQKAVAVLTRSPAVAYASPDFDVSPMHLH